MHIKIKRGLNIPVKGENALFRKELPLPRRAALDLSPFFATKFTLLKKEGHEVKRGEPIAVDKECEGRNFVAPASGKIVAVNRGEKRRLLSIDIETDVKQESHPVSATGVMDRLKEGGLFAHIRARPCDRLADPSKPPRSIFIKAIESAPFTPPPELELKGNEEDFKEGLRVLKEIAPVHLIERADHFPLIDGVQRHTAEGPHPIANPSLHIYHIDPLLSAEATVWTLGVRDVIAIGHLFKTGYYYNRRLIRVAGEPFSEEERGDYLVYQGHAVSELPQPKSGRLISGDPLTGQKVENEGFLGFYHNVFCAFDEETRRELLHFMRMGGKKYTATRTYCKFLGRKEKWHFTTNQHGEERPFIDGAIYDKVMPMRVPTMHLLKALIAEDFDKAEQLGLLEVTGEDFALASFICPSKIPMTEIVRNALNTYSSQYL